MTLCDDSASTMPSSRSRQSGRGSQPSIALEPGLLIGGKYELIRMLGEGGMAEVWVAMHVPLRTEVAVKFVNRDLVEHATAGSEVMERFRFEAQVSARLCMRTRNIVAVHDADIFLGRPYLVMELIDGRDLDELLGSEGPLPPEQLADLLDQLADALDAAHSFGVMHRDLKPSNVLLTSDGKSGVVAKVADFGVAKAVATNVPVESPKVTVMGALVGSPAYMSPEQIRGDVTIDGRSDLWSLGVLAYEALTGRVPFAGESVGVVMTAVVSGKFEPPSKLRPGLPRAVDAWFERALAVERAERFGTAKEMAAAFRAAVRGGQRRPRVAVRVAGLIGAVILLGVAVIGVVISSGTAEAPQSGPSSTGSLSAPPPPPAHTGAAESAAIVRPVETATPPPPATTAGNRAPVPTATASTSAAVPAAPRPPPSLPTARPPRKIDPSEIQ
jgi:serine/threonine-protein kinase